MTSRFAIAILAMLILALGAGLRLARLGADPDPLRSLTNSNGVVTDPGWYLAVAVDHSYAHPADVGAQYEKPIFTALARLGFALGGVTPAGTQITAALAGIFLILAGGAAAWIAFGSRAGLCAGFLLATSFPLVGYGRIALVYGPLAAGLAIVFALAAVGLKKPPAMWLAWLTLAALVIWLKETAILAAPGLALATIAGSKHPRRSALAVCALGIVALIVVVAVFPDRLASVVAKLQAYAGNAAGMPSRLIRGPFLDRFVPFSAVPLLLAAIGGLGVFQAELPRSERIFIGALAAWFAVTILVQAPLRFYPDEGGFVPLRHLVPALVPAAILAAVTIRGVSPATLGLVLVLVTL
ncbi:MAG: ArnT family glycosyltransferase, partial [Polyangiaceae bacterium]